MADEAMGDTGFVVAILNQNDDDHQSCLDIYKAQHGYIIVPQSALAEITYMLNRNGGSKLVINFLHQIPNLKFRFIALEGADFRRTLELLEKYADTRVDFVDVSVAAIAERLGISKILTLDKRDFSIIRPKHVEYFELQP